jgi:hypothetical protein
MSTQFLKLIAVAVVTLVVSGLAPVSALAAMPAAESILTEAELDETIEMIKKLYAEANELLKELPQDRFDRDWVLEQADFEVERIVEWVEKNIRWVPYQGVLRGAEGVLLDRRGNSLDRSLLLAALLEDAGYEARLARGQLSKTVVEQVIQRVDSEAFAPEPLESYSLVQARAVVGRAAEQAAALARMIEISDHPWSAGLEPALADHWWVEAKLESGWQSFDPLLSTFPENARPQVDQRFALTALPGELFHKVSVRVVIERWDQGTLTEEIPLAHSLNTAAGLAQDLELRFVPFGFAAVPEDSDARAEVLAVADTTLDWLPLFRIGEDPVRQQGFGRDGRLEQNPAKPAVHRKLGSATSALGNLGLEEKRPEPELTACWIEYAIEVPGREPQIVRREIFDLIGPAHRRKDDLTGLTFDSEASRERGMALQGVSRILITGTDIPPVLLERASLELWARQGPQMAAIIRLVNDPEAEEPLGRMLKEPLVPLDLLALAMVRSELSRFREAIFIARPNILTTHSFFRAGEELEIVQAVDIVANEVEVMAGGANAPSRIRLEQGVLDTVLEAALSAREGPSHNTAELFALRGESTGDWVRMQGSSESSLLSAEARARTASAIAAGRLVVAPERVEKGTAPAWWEIDPTTGTTLGIGSKGWGTDITETTITTGIRGEGTRQGSAKLGRSAACQLLWVFLTSQGMVTQGGFLWSQQAVQMWFERGC